MMGLGASPFRMKNVKSQETIDMDISSVCKSSTMFAYSQTDPEYYYDLPDENITISGY